jgi:hypothetical protein
MATVGWSSSVIARFHQRRFSSGQLASLFTLAIACLFCSAQAGQAIAQTRWQGNLSHPAREYSQSAEKSAKGQLFLTQGLVCDNPSQVDAVVTLSNSGDALERALEQINAGAEVPRCVVGRVLIARYVEKARSFTVANREFNVHRVLIVGIGMKKENSVVPMSLERPLEQFVVTTDTSQPI